MGAKEVDFTKLNQAVAEFGSLQKANAQLNAEKAVLGKESTQLKQDNKQMTAHKGKLAGQIAGMSSKVKSCQSQLQSLYDQIKVHSRQYELFCGFMAMVAESPSVTDSIDILIAALQKLKETGWYLPKNADEMRSLFICTIMGDYLKCFRCDACGAKFITNQKPKYKLFGNGYYCPVCHNWYAIKEDDSFLEAMVSEKQLKDTRNLDKLMEEYRVLEPFKAFLDMQCEICHEPIKEWDDYNVKLVIQDIGCGHTQCWNGTVGQIRQLGKVVQKIKQDMQ